MRISELAKAAGLSIDTIRFYEKEGLLDEQHFERLPNNYRCFNAAALARLTMIKWGKLLGFTLQEIKVTLGHWEAAALTAEQKEAIFCQKLQEIEQVIDEMTRMQAYVQKKLHMLRSGMLPDKPLTANNILTNPTSSAVQRSATIDTSLLD